MNPEIKNRFMKDFHKKYRSRNTQYSDKGRRKYIIRKVEDMEENVIIENGISQYEEGESDD